MYFFYIDESGNRDVKVDEPYVLTAVGMYENQWRGFNKHLMGMKTNIARQYDKNIRQDQLEVKANLLTKPYDRPECPFFKHLSDEEITHISEQYYQQLEFSKMAVIAVVIDKAKLREGTTLEQMHRKAYEMLLERIQHFMRNNYHKHNALIIMDDTGAILNRRIALIHADFLRQGNNNMSFKNIIEYPFFAASELSNGIQLADLVAYSLYYTFKHSDPDYAYFDKILPRISRHADDSGALTGLKIWPDSEKYEANLDAIKRKLNSGRGE